MTPLQLLTLACAVTDKKVEEAKASLSLPLNERVEPFSVRFEGGEISMSEPVEYTPTAEIPMLTVLVIALKKSGIMSEHIKGIIVDAVNTAVSNGGDIGGELRALVSDAKQEIDSLKTTFAVKLPKKRRSGPLKVKGKFTLLA